MLLAIGPLSLTGLLVGFCLWMALLLVVHRWGKPGNGPSDRASDDDERSPVSGAFSEQSRSDAAEGSRPRP